MRVLFDTNVLISAFIAHGPSSEVFEYCLAHCRVFTSTFILGELERVLEHKIRLSSPRIREILEFLKENLEMVEADSREEKVCRDPADDLVLAAAVTAEVDCILTGDEDLLTLGVHKGISIIKPAQFWRFERTGRRGQTP